MTTEVLSATDRLLLRALLSPEPETAREAGQLFLTTVDLQVAPWSQARLFPALYQRLAQHGAPAPALLRGTYRRAWSQNQLRFRAVARTMAKLSSSGIPNLVLKGASLVPAYGGDWGVRDMSDVDLLVPFGDIDRTAELLGSDGWTPRLGHDISGALARVVDRRHSWAFEHPDGHQLDLHWHVLQTSRGPNSDCGFFADSVALDLGTVRARRLNDADLLLHVLEHASHGEESSKLQWIVDAVTLIRATPGRAAAARRLAAQARAHRLVGPVRECLNTICTEFDGRDSEPMARALDDPGRSTASPRSAWGRWYDEYRSGGTSRLRASRALLREVLDLPLVDRRLMWSMYVAGGRRPSVEALLTRVGGRLTRSPVAATPETAPDGWWDMWNPHAVDSMCGPGWWYPEPDAQGIWSEGREARLHVPVSATERFVELQLSLLGQHDGPARSVRIRSAGRTHHVLHAAPGHSWHHVRVPVDGRHRGAITLSVLVDPPSRPCELGIGLDRRRLGVLLHRLRVSP